MSIILYVRQAIGCHQLMKLLSHQSLHLLMPLGISTSQFGSSQS